MRVMPPLAPRPYEYEPGGKFSHLNSVRRRTPVSPGSGLQQRSNPGCEAAPTDGSDDGDGSSELASESEESSKHDSDDDVPRSLWLAEFELARRGKNGDGKSSAKEAAGSKNRVPSYRTSPGRKVGKANWDNLETAWVEPGVGCGFKVEETALVSCCMLVGHLATLTRPCSRGC